MCFLRLVDVGTVSRPKSSIVEPLGSKHGGLEATDTPLDRSFFRYDPAVCSRGRR